MKENREAKKTNWHPLSINPEMKAANLLLVETHAIFYPCISQALNESSSVSFQKSNSLPLDACRFPSLNP